MPNVLKAYTTKGIAYDLLFTISSNSCATKLVAWPNG